MSAPRSPNEDDENLDVPELGDIITLKSSNFGSYTGKIIYRSEDLIRVQSIEAEDQAMDVEMADDGDFAEGTGISEYIIHSKRTDPHFSIQLGVSEGERLEFYTMAGEKAAEPGIVASIESEENDAIVLTDGRRLNFMFIGPPAPVAIVSVRAADAIPEESGAAPVAEEALPDDYDLSLLEHLLPAALAEDVPTAERFFDETVQREDMYIDLLKDYNKAKQGNPTVIRRVARETELLLALKHACQVIGPDGRYQPYVKSAKTLEDLMTRLGSPLSSIIPVLAVKRILYYGKSDETGNEVDIETPTEEMMAQVEFRSWLVNELSNYRSSTSYLAGRETGGAAQISKLMYSYLYDILYANGAVFVPGIGSKDGETIQVDQDALRTVLPPEKVLGYSSGLGANVDTSNVGQIKTRQHRFIGSYKSKDNEVTIAPGDPATINSYIVLPSQIGATYRPVKYSGSLSEDIRGGNITSNLLPLENLTNNPKAYTDTGLTVVKLNAVPDEDEDTPEPIQIHEYIDKNLKNSVHPSDLLSPASVGVNRVIDSIGLRSYEWTPEVAGVIWRNVAAAQANYLDAYNAYKLTVASDNSTYQFKSGIPVDSPIFAKSTAVPEIEEALSLLKQMSPESGDWDLAKAQHLLYTAETTLARVLYLSLAPDVHPNLKKARETYLGEVKRSLLRFASINASLAQYKAAPVINTCPHVKDKEHLRAVMNRDDTKFQALLNTFLKRYQGSRDKDSLNWVNCSVCNDHLICIHEVMKYYEVTHPGKAPALHKDILLNFGGAAFNGRYVCRNCGVPISEFEYDTHLEFDDEGKPLVGRAVVTDEKTVDDELDSILNISLKKKTISFENPVQAEIYDLLRTIVQNTGFSFEEEEYRKMVIFIHNYITSTLPPKDVYEQLTAKRKVRQPYESFRATTTVSCIGAYLLCYIHSKSPLPEVLFPFGGCDFSRGGFPIETDQERPGALEYFVCVIANLNKINEPWNMLAWSTESSPERRMGMVREKIVKLLNEPELVVELKRAQISYSQIQNDLKSNASANDRIPGSFRPVQSVNPPVMEPEEMTYPDRILKAATDAALEEITPVVIKRNKELAISSILTAHKDAANNGLINETSLRSDSNCCFISLKLAKDVGLATFNDVAKETEIEALRAAEELLQKRDPTAQTNGAHLFVRWSPPEQIKSLAVSPDASYFKLFMRTCFRGPREGLYHEFGRRGTRYECRHCGFNLSRDPLVLMSDLNDEEIYNNNSKRKGEPRIVVQTEAREALKAAGLTVDADSFTKLLASVRKTHPIIPYEIADLPVSRDIYARLESLIYTESPLLPARLADWTTVQRVMTANFGRTTEPSEETRKIAWAPFVSRYDALRLALLDVLDGRQGRAPVRAATRKSEEILAAIEAITIEPIHKGPAEVIKHWIVGLERLGQGFNEMIFGVGTWFGQTTGNANKIRNYLFNGTKWFGKKISEKHSETFQKMIDTILGANTDTNKELSVDNIRGPSAELLHRLATYLGRILLFWKDNMVGFGVYGVSIEELQYMLRWIVLSSIESLLLIESPLFNRVGKEAQKISIQRILLLWVRQTFLESNRQYQQFSMNDDQIRLAIEDAREKEKNSIIKEIDDEKDPDLRAINMMQKKLKIGRWAVGSKGNPTQYNGAMFDFLQEQRDRAGIADKSNAAIPREDPLGFDFGNVTQDDAKYDTYAAQDEDEGGGGDM